MNEIDLKPAMMSVEEVAFNLVLDGQTVRKLARRGQIPGAKKMGGTWRFNRKKFFVWTGEPK